MAPYYDDDDENHDAFVDFKDDVLFELRSHGVVHDAVQYVVLGGSMWCSIETFSTLEKLPYKHKRPIINRDGAWGNVPRTFAVVLKDMRWLTYTSCRDPRYCKWIMNSLPVRPKKEYANNAAAAAASSSVAAAAAASSSSS